MRSFTALDADEFVELVGGFPWVRRVVEVHLHHTWRPSYEHYDGLRTIEGMWRHHTQVNGWSDIAQHVSIAPDGKIWIGRNFNWSPASASGFNGNSSAGPFMIELIGDFDIGKDTMSEAQHHAALTVIRAVQQRHDLAPDKLKFHAEMSSKTCPGTQHDKGAWIAALAGFELPRPPVPDEECAFPGATRGIGALLGGMNPLADQTDNLADAEHPLEDDLLRSTARELARSADAVGDAEALPRGLSRDALSLLADHVINLSGGQLSDSGIISTSRADVERIVNERIATAISVARESGEKARILLFAHGGLTSERGALAGALDQLALWRSNGIYPLFFIWETGIGETLKFMLQSVSGLERAPRGMVREWLDERVEDAVRFAGADRLWGAMKYNALLAGAKDGGATLVAGELVKLLKQSPDDVELHLAGFSAGAIFMARVLDTLARVPIRTLHLLAPAIDNALFHETVAPRVGKEVDELVVYTMRKQLELGDSVTPLYARSLLYLVANALEPERPTAILGLEESLRSDRAAARLFGLGGQERGKAEVVWSQSDGAATGDASSAGRHGDFDSDKATLESMVRRITGKRSGEPIVPYRGSGGTRSALFDEPLSVPGDLGRWLFTGSGGTGGASCSEPAVPAPASSPAPSPSPSPSPAPASTGGGGRKLALCLGIDDYPHITKLKCCRNDARAWSDKLEALGFAVSIIPQHEATSAALKQRLEDFVGGAREGDRLVFQYSGHGTLVTDNSGDEAAGAKDSCLCTWDCNNPAGEGGLVIDDELFAIMQKIADGAQLTGFIDCCHSGTMARALFSPAPRALPADAAPRAVEMQPAMIEAYRRAKTGMRSVAPDPGEVLKAVFFNACQDTEVAWEFEGSGHFSRIAAPLLAQGRGITNAEFAEKVIAAFGSNPRQLPKLHCDPSKRLNPLALF